MNRVSHADNLAMSKSIAVTTNAPPVLSGHPVIRKADVPVTVLAYNELLTVPRSPPTLHLHLLPCLYPLVIVVPTHFVIVPLGSTAQFLVTATDLSPTTIILIWTWHGMKLPMQTLQVLLDPTMEVLIKVIPGVFTIHQR